MTTNKRGQIKLAILDFDNCVTDTLFVWEKTLSQGLKALCDGELADMSMLYTMTREAHGQHRFNDFPKLIDWMRENQPSMLPKSEEEKERMDSVCASAKEIWYRETKELTKFYPDVVRVLREIDNAGTTIVFQTDCEQAPFVRRLYLCALAATNAQELTHPAQIFDYIDHSYCQPGIVKDDPLMHVHVPEDFVSAALSKCTLWDGLNFKPSHAHIDRILNDHKVSGSETVYLGDTHKDGCEAKLADPQAQFAWCRYGAKVAPKILKFYAEVGSRSYSYGLSTILQMFEEKAIKPDAVLHRNMMEVFEHYDFVPNRAAPQAGPAIHKPKI